MTIQYYIKHKTHQQYGTMILCSNNHIAVLWEAGNKTIHTIPDNTIELHEAGNNLKQPALHQALPIVRRMLDAAYPLENVK